MIRTTHIRRTLPNQFRACIRSGNFRAARVEALSNGFTLAGLGLLANGYASRNRDRFTHEA